MYLYAAQFFFIPASSKQPLVRKQPMRTLGPHTYSTWIIPGVASTPEAKLLPLPPNKPGVKHRII
jgi:hypothetical protein